MMGYFKDIFKFKQAIPVILLIIGVPLFVICSFGAFGLESAHKHWFRLLDGLSSVIVMSALVSFLVDSVEFMGVFKRALEDIIYDSKFLKKRKDIDEIWVKVSKELFKSKFPQISNPLMQTVRKYYESDDGLKLSYYNDYVNTYTLTLDENDRNIIHVVQDVSFTLNVEDKEKFPFPMTMWTCTSAENKDKVTLLCENVTVNGKPATAEVSEPKYEEGTLRYDYKLQLEGSTEYKIKQRITKKYNLKEDNFIGHKARWLVNGLRVKVFHPKELGILFVNRGVMGEFSKEEREDFKEYEFKGLILKHQGYILTIIPKGN